MSAKIKLVVIMVVSLCIGLFLFTYAEMLGTKIRVKPTQVEIIETVMQSVVAVYHPSINIPASGFYIGDGVIVTAGHVAKMDGIKKVVFEDGTKYPVLRQIVHPDYDCGFLIIENIDRPILKFDLKEVQRGENIFTLGHPVGLTFIVTKGIVTGRSDAEGFFGNTLLITTDAVTQPGNSGSVLIDEDGEIRGVHVGGKIGNCGSPLHGYEVDICVSDILKAMETAKLKLPSTED